MSGEHRGQWGRRPLLGMLLAAMLLALPVFGAGPAAAAGEVTATASLDGKPLAGANARDPIRLDPSKVAQIIVELTNGTGKPVAIRRVDVTGHVLGLNFFSYSTAVDMTVAAGKTERLTYRLDAAGLDGQATGLIGADLAVIGTDGKPVAKVATIVDVRGSLFSVYGLFGIILAVLTGLAIADAALTVARHRLSVNRWQRGLRLLAPGIGIGLMLGFTASVARWWVPATGLWLALAGATATLFFLIGYLSPTPDQGDDLDLDAADLAAARELDAHGYGEPASVGGRALAHGYAMPGESALGAPGFGSSAAGLRGFGASESAQAAPGPGSPRPDRGDAPDRRGRMPGPFGPAVSGHPEGAGAAPHRPPGPGWHDPSDEDTVTVPPPHRPGESDVTVAGPSHSRGHGIPGPRERRMPGGTLQDIGGTLPDLPAPAETLRPGAAGGHMAQPPAPPLPATRDAADHAATVGHGALDLSRRGADADSLGAGSPETLSPAASGGHTMRSPAPSPGARDVADSDDEPTVGYGALDLSKHSGDADSPPRRAGSPEAVRPAASGGHAMRSPAPLPGARDVADSDDEPTVGYGALDLSKHGDADSLEADSSETVRTDAATVRGAGRWELRGRTGSDERASGTAGEGAGE